MNRPWDNEPTPLCDLADEDWNTPYGFARLSFAQRMERRARHAEALLERATGHDDLDAYTMEQAAAHLAAAREEDAR